MEQRRFVRAKFDCKIIIHTPKEHVIVSHTENIGAGGIMVIINESLQVSSVVGLEIYLNGEPIVCSGRIAWAVENQGCYDTGVEFTKISEEDRRVIDNLVKSIVS